MIAALKQNTIVDYVTMVFVNLGYAIPNFLLCTLLIYFFAVKWGDVTGFPTNGIEGGWKSWVLPAIALGHAPMTLFARIVRGSMLETLQQDYIRTARAKGLRRRRVVGLHVLRNSLIPAVTAAGTAARLPDHRLVHRRVHLRDPRDRPLLRHLRDRT